MPNQSPSIAERHKIDGGSWIATLSPSLCQAILDGAEVRRLHDGERPTTCGTTAQEGCGVAEGDATRGALALAQEDLAQLRCASSRGVWLVLGREKCLALPEQV